MHRDWQASADVVAGMTDKYPHSPGSDTAITDGCACPVLDNAHGKGCGYLTEHGEPVYIVNAECKLHGSAEFFPDDMRFVRDLTEPSYGAASRLSEKIA